jgi:hypothetical protein
MAIGAADAKRSFWRGGFGPSACGSRTDRPVADALRHPATFLLALLHSPQSLFLSNYRRCWTLAGVPASAGQDGWLMDP